MRLKNNFKIKKDQLTIPVGTRFNKFSIYNSGSFSKREVICLATIYKRQGLQLLVKTASVLKKKILRLNLRLLAMVLI